MTVSQTTNLGLPLITTGTESSTWGDIVDNGLTSYIDIAVTGTLSLTSASFTANALTLSNTFGTSSATNIGTATAQYAVIKLSSLAAAVTITAPSVSKTYVVANTDSTYAATIKASGQTGVSIAAGEMAVVWFNGTDYVKVMSQLVYASSRVPYGNGTMNFNTSTQFQYNGTYLLVGAASALGGLTNPVAAFTGNPGTTNYVQAYVYNSQNGISSSGDFVAYASNSTDAHGWADMGFTSPSYADPTYTVTGPNEAYLFASAPYAVTPTVTGNAVYATDSTGTQNYHQWYVGGFTQAKGAWKMQLTPTGLQLANTLAPAYGGTGATTGVYGFKNRIINGALNVAQYGTSGGFSGVGNAASYVTDRWIAASGGSTPSITYALASTTLPSPQSGVTQNALTLTQAATTGSLTFAQRIESTYVADLYNTTVTVGLYAASSASATVTWTAYYANTADTWTSVGSSSGITLNATSIATGTFTTTSSLTFQNFSFSMGTNAPTKGLMIVFTISATTSQTFTLTGVQLEKGSTATSFDYRSYQDELLLCNRYYGNYGGVLNTTALYLTVATPRTAMRATPTVVGLTFPAGSGGALTFSAYPSTTAFTGLGTVYQSSSHSANTQCAFALNAEL